MLQHAGVTCCLCCAAAFLCLHPAAHCHVCLGCCLACAGSTTSGFSGGDLGTAAAAAAGGRKPPLVINLATIRAARKSAAALHSLEECIIVEGQQVRAKPKPKAMPAAPPPLPMTATQKHK
jgi:hypothetical protein